MSRASAFARGVCDDRVAHRRKMRTRSPEQVARDRAEHAWRHGPAFAPSLLGAATLAAWPVLVAIVVVCVVAIGGAP